MQLSEVNKIQEQQTTINKLLIHKMFLLCVHPHLPTFNVSFVIFFIAYDFVGQWSDVVSSGVTVDTSPPAVTRPWLEGTTDRTQPLRLRWEPVREWESQVESVEWGVGSRPGSSDLQGWTVANTGEISGAASVGERQDGRLVFLSVKVSHHQLE